MVIATAEVDEMISVNEHILHIIIDKAANRVVHIVSRDICRKSGGLGKDIVERLVSGGSEEVAFGGSAEVVSEASDIDLCWRF